MSKVLSKQYTDTRVCGKWLQLDSGEVIRWDTVIRLQVCDEGKSYVCTAQQIYEFLDVPSEWTDEDNYAYDFEVEDINELHAMAVEYIESEECEATVINPDDVMNVIWPKYCDGMVKLMQIRRTMEKMHKRDELPCGCGTCKGKRDE